MAVAAGVSDSAIASANGQARAKRYWPGKAPDWARDPDDDHLELPCVATLLDKAFPQPGDRADTAAVRRLADAESRGELRPDQEVVFATDSAYQEEGEVVPAAENEEDEEERRRRILERRLLRQRGDEELLPREENDILADEDEELECETDSEEDEAVCIAVVKPVFVQKSQRDTVAETERTMEEKRVKKRTEERKVETRRIVVEVIMKEEKIEKTQSEEAADTMDIDTDDEFNAEDEYEAWKNREVSRIREAREARSREKGEAKKVRTMAEEEHMDLESMDRKPPAELKQGRKFLQKYYHRGAFFQEKPDDGRRTFSPDDIYMRDFSEATGEDKMDKFILHKVMQVKNFGRKGRPKGTHLSNEDTTHWSIPLLEN